MGVGIFSCVAAAVIITSRCHHPVSFVITPRARAFPITDGAHSSVTFFTA